MPDAAATITLRELARALAAHAVHTSVSYTVREVVGNSANAPTRAELIDTLAGEIEAAARR
jgi:hypothetical protein